MLKYVTLLLALQLKRDTTALNQALNREFVLKRNPLYGPRRLSGVRLAPSLISCAVSCMSSFLDDCQSVLYNEETHFCTPGQGLDPLQPKPSATEGFLHIHPQCESSEGFSMQTFGDTQVCVFYQTQNLSYTDAADVCASMESRLYTVKDINRFYLLRKLFKNGLWVGLDDLVTEGVYVWSDGSVFDGNFTDMFLPDEPNNYGGEEDCIIMQYPMPYKLNDDSCNKTYNSVCEKP